MNAPQLIHLTPSVRGRGGPDRLVLWAGLERSFKPTYGPQHVSALSACDLELARLKEELNSTRGDKTDLRRQCRDQKDIRDKLLERREKALQHLLDALDRSESARLFTDPLFREALYVQCDPDAAVSAILAIHRARSGGHDSLFDTAADLATNTEVASAAAGVGTHEHFERTAFRLRHSDLLFEVSQFPSLSSDEKVLFEQMNDRMVKFLCMMLASDRTQAARRQIEAHLPDPRSLELVPFDVFVTRLVSQLALLPSGSGGASRGPATALAVKLQSTERGDRPRRDVSEITCFLCGKKGHYQRTCPSSVSDADAAAEAQPPAAVVQHTGLTVAELVSFRRMLAEGRGPRATAAVVHIPSAEDDDDDYDV